VVRGKIALFFFFLRTQGTRQIKRLGSKFALESVILPAAQKAVTWSARRLGPSIAAAGQNGGAAVAVRMGTNINPVALNMLNSKLNERAVHQFRGPQIIQRTGWRVLRLSAFNPPSTRINTLGIWITADEQTEALRTFFFRDPKFRVFPPQGSTPDSRDALFGETSAVVRHTY